jgi:hypothetical protein
MSTTLLYELSRSGTEAHSGAWRAIWAYSAKRARRDQKTLAAREARARAILNGEKTAKSARFVKTRGTDRSLDEANLARARSPWSASRATSPTWLPR